MPVKQLTPEEVEEILGGGLLSFGPPQPKPIVRPGGDPPEDASSHMDTLAGDDEAVDEAQAGGQPRNLDQEAHDRRMLALSDEERHRMVKGLGDLMRGREAEEPAPQGTAADPMQTAVDEIEEWGRRVFKGK